MIAVLLLGALLVLGVLGLGVYLLFLRPDPPAEAGEPRAEAPADPAQSSSERPGERPGGGSGTSSGTGPPSTEELESTVRYYVDAVNGRDETAATALTCERADPGALFSATGGYRVELGKVEIVSGAVGTAQVRVGDGTTALLLEMQEDGWCVAI
jgi:hypothetical protein